MVVMLVTEEKKVEVKSPRSYQVGLAVCIIVIVVLGGTLSSTYQGQLNQIDSLKSQVNSLTTEGDSLKDQVTTLAAERDSLTAQVNDLQSKYNELIDINNELNDVVNLNKSMVLDENQTVILPAWVYHTLPYTTSHAGYIRVDFAASGDVYFMVGSRFTGGWYATYPLTGTATSGRFTIPVFPGTTYLYVGNPGLLASRVAVAFTITYIY
jgi:cell division protein FtsB